MLFRRSANYSFILLVVPFLIHASEQLDAYLRQGKELGGSFQFMELSQKEIEAITPLQLRGQSFDSEQARKQMNSTSHQEVEKSNYINLDPAIEATLENAESSLTIKSGTAFLNEGEYETTEKCLIESELIHLDIEHALTVQLIQNRQVSQSIKICNGHYEEKKSLDPKKSKKKAEKAFASDPSIKKYKVSIDKNGLGHRDIVESWWWHVDNAETCQSFRAKPVGSKSSEEIDIWKRISPEPSNIKNCILINTTQGPSETRQVEGKRIERPFWNKTDHYLCVEQVRNDCGFIKEKNCILTSNTCIRKIENRCLVWENVFKCRTQRPQEIISSKEGYGTDSRLWETDYTPNQDFSDTATKLAVFNEMKKELQHSKDIDVRSARLFTGSKQQCSKSIAENLMYDCCSDMGGLATEVKLSKCTSDEIALAESRRKGLTHYVGEKKEKFIELWVSRKERVFCVFPSKLSRVFQEASRKQLNIGWGDAEHPDCRGLTQEEIKRIDFTKIDLSEAFENLKIIDNGDKIKRIEERLKKRIENMK